MTGYVELNRQFQELDPNAESEATAFESYLATKSSGKADRMGWQEILGGKQSVVVLGEPGSGKTFELQAVERSVSASGNAAAIFDIVSMVNASEPPLGIDDLRSLEGWRAGNKDAWLFLDAVDESKLLRSTDFHTSLRRIAAWVGPQWRRTRYVISSRITEWRHTVDKPKVEEEFHVRIKVLKLLPLTAEQVERLVQDRDSNAKAFIAAVEAMDAWEFVGRPQDALDLYGLWAKSGRLGTKTDMLEQSTNIKLRLEEDRSGLAPDKLRQGAEHLSACLHLTKALSIALDETQSNGADNVVTLAQCLPSDWSDKERRELIRRPLFNDAAFGRVRMHHRTHQDYLAACWLRSLMELDCPYPELRQLIFEEIGSGAFLLRPFMKSVAAWLACIAPKQQGWADALLADLQKYAPWAFFVDGDPQSLSLDARRVILRSVVENFRDRTYVQIDWDAATLKRFADPALAADLSAWIADTSISEDIRADYVMVVRHGRLQSAMPSVVAVAIGELAGEYLRAIAFGCIARIGSIEHRKIVFQDAQAAVSIPQRLIGWIAMCIYPSVADEHELFTTLAKLANAPKKFSSSSLDQFEREGIEGIPESRAATFLRELIGFASDATGAMRVDRTWAADWIEPAILRVLRMHSLTKQDIDTTVAALDLLASARKQQLTRDGRSSKSGDLNTLSLQHSELRRSWYWARYRRALKRNDAQPLHLFQIKRHDDPIAPHSSDRSWWLDDALSTSLPAEQRRFALGAALDLRWITAPPPPTGIPTGVLIAALRDSNLRKVLIKELASTLTAPWAKLQQKWEWDWSRRYYWRQKWQPIAKMYWHTYNKIHFLLKRDRIASGEWWGACQHIIESARLDTSDKATSTWGGIGADDIDRQYGSAVGAAVRAGFDRHWRAYEPALPHEKAERHQTAAMTIFGLIALNIAWSTEGESYFASLSLDDARRATRYALNELNGVPEWLLSLARLHRPAVQRVLDDAIRAEWQNTSADAEWGSDTLGRLRGAEGDLVRLALPTLRALLECGVPANTNVLLDALRIVLQYEDDHGRDWLSGLARQRLSESTSTDVAAWNWLSVLMQFDADVAFATVEVWQTRPESDAIDIAVTLCATLANRRDSDLGIDESDYRRPGFLLRFIPWVFEHIRPEDDPVHEGVYSPGARDDAADFRRRLIALLVVSDELDAEATLLRLAAAPELTDSADSFKEALDRRRARLADRLHLKPDDLSDLMGRDHDRAPRSRADLFHVAMRRIESFKDRVERAEISLRHEVALGWKEKDYQRWIQGHLIATRKDRYVLTAESEVDPGKYPDLRFENPSIDGAISVEIKLADGRSYESLESDLHDQLVRQYLRAPNANYGIYLLFHDGAQKHWAPTGRSRLDWNGLLIDLQATANRILERRLDIERLVVVGIHVAAPPI